MTLPVVLVLFFREGEVCLCVADAVCVFAEMFACWLVVELAGGLKLDDILVEAVALTDKDLAGVGDEATGGEDGFMSCGCDLLHRFGVSMERDSRG